MCWFFFWRSHFNRMTKIIELRIWLQSINKLKLQVSLTGLFGCVLIISFGSFSQSSVWVTHTKRQWEFLFEHCLKKCAYCLIILLLIKTITMFLISFFLSGRSTGSGGSWRERGEDTRGLHYRGGWREREETRGGGSDHGNRERAWHRGGHRAETRGGQHFHPHHFYPNFQDGRAQNTRHHPEQSRGGFHSNRGRYRLAPRLHQNYQKLFWYLNLHNSWPILIWYWQMTWEISDFYWKSLECE